LNEYSLVSRLDCGIKVLFTGDAGKATEEKLLALGTDLSADILKVGHHGSLSASSDDFLSAVDPFRAVISAGIDNRYGLPAVEVVRRLAAKGVFVHRTDHGGSVKFRFGRDGKLLRP
jgi:beta-lactamase superfamily II metal-dependent hydrolase